jgi:glycosyltransferase involved in cell wall biosynthesis
MPKPLRVLQVVHSMNRGGIETWLMNVLRNIDRERFAFDFMVYTTKQCAYDDELRALGARILPCIPPSQSLSHLADVQRVMSSGGSYDAVHAHGDVEVGVPLLVAARVGIPIRIAHSHNAPVQQHRRLRSYLFRPALRRLMEMYLTHGLGCSGSACAHLFGARWKADKRVNILNYGLDWAPFKKPVERNAIRAQLDLPHDAMVIGHVGRFELQKNHFFFLELARRIVNQRPDAYFLLVGDGALRSVMQERASALGLGSRVIFVGMRADTPEMLQAMDIFLFPSLFEGLGIALLEAQSVGLPCVISDVVPTAAIVIESQVRRLPLLAPPDVWAQAALEMAAQYRSRQHAAAWNAVAQGQFSIQHCIAQLISIYDGKTREERDRG